jgi:hypothetical protein
MKDIEVRMIINKSAIKREIKKLGISVYSRTIKEYDQMLKEELKNAVTEAKIEGRDFLLARHLRKVRRN